MIARLLQQAACAVLLCLLLTNCDRDQVSDEKTPQIQILNETVTVPADGGSAAVNYIIQNPVVGGTLETTTEEKWIHVIEDTGNRINFSVEPYMEKENRSTLITLTYKYNGNEVSSSANIIQEASKVDYRFNAPNLFGNYYGPDMSIFHIYLSDKTSSDGYFAPDGTYYFFDVHTGDIPESNGGTAVFLPEGEYVLGSNQDHYFSSQYSRWYKVDANGINYADGNIGFSSGIMTVKRDGDIYFYSAELTDMNGKTHTVSYSGPGEIKDLTPQANSTLREDYTIPFRHQQCSVQYIGDEYGIGTARWTVLIQNDNGEGDVVQFELYADISITPDQGMPTGEYTAAMTGQSGTFFPGYFYDPETDEFVGAWWWVVNNGDIGYERAPFMDNSKITITDNGDGKYSIAFDCLDDFDPQNRITGTWTGMPKFL